jgi:hypothetical protein
MTQGLLFASYSAPNLHRGVLAGCVGLIGSARKTRFASLDGVFLWCVCACVCLGTVKSLQCMCSTHTHRGLWAPGAGTAPGGLHKLQGCYKVLWLPTSEVSGGHGHRSATGVLQGCYRGMLWTCEVSGGYTIHEL